MLLINFPKYLIQVQPGDSPAGRLDAAPGEATAGQQFQLTRLTSQGLPPQQQGGKHAQIKLERIQWK